MIHLTLDLLNKIAGKPVDKDNATSVIKGLATYPCGLEQPHRLAQYLAQLLHESASFRYDREVWGPTATQKRYEGRKDLGNTQPGDGSKFRGYTAIQITGRANTTEFMKWCEEKGLNPPNFVDNPELMNTDPWEGLGPLWYWDTRDLNKYADDGNIEMITRRINGGLNGFEDRSNYYTKAALVLLGYNNNAVKDFQAVEKIKVDGIVGPTTRARMHEALKQLPKILFTHEPTATTPSINIDQIEKLTSDYIAALKRLTNV